MAKRKKTAVVLDAGAVSKIESALRGGLTGAACINVATVPPPKGKSKTAAVTLDPAAVARFTEHLRSGLVSAAAINRAENADVDAETKKVR